MKKYLLILYTTKGKEKQRIEFGARDDRHAKERITHATPKNQEYMLYHQKPFGLRKLIDCWRTII